MVDYNRLPYICQDRYIHNIWGVSEPEGGNGLATPEYRWIWIPTNSAILGQSPTEAQPRQDMLNNQEFWFILRIGYFWIRNLDLWSWTIRIRKVVPMKIWDTFQLQFTPGQSMVTSIFNPQFQTAKRGLNFSNWMNHDLHQCNQLYSSRTTVLKSQIFAKVSDYPGVQFQYQHIRNFLSLMQRRCGIPRALTPFEC